MHKLLPILLFAYGFAVTTEDIEDGELLTDEEEKQVWKEFQGKEEEGDN